MPGVLPNPDTHLCTLGEDRTLLHAVSKRAGIVTLSRLVTQLISLERRTARGGREASTTYLVLTTILRTR